MLATRRGVAGAHPVDLYVGQRIRHRRRQLGLSQAALGERIGVSFQQIQKYERGANRVSVSTLQEIAQAFGWTVGKFMETLPPLPGAEDGAAADPVQQVLSDPLGQELVAAFLDIRSRRVRVALVRLARDLAPGTEGSAG